MTSKIMPIAAAPMALANVTGASGQTVTDLCSPAAMTADVGPVTAETLNYGGTDRYYCTYTSSLIGSGTQQPLLMALHGGNGNAAQMMRDSRRIIANAESGGGTSPCFPTACHVHPGPARASAPTTVGAHPITCSSSPSLASTAPGDAAALWYRRAGNGVVEVMDLNLGHAWPVWDLMAVIMDFFERT